MLDEERDGSLFVAIVRGLELRQCVKPIRKGEEPLRLKLTNIVFAFILDKFGDMVETSDLPLEPFHIFREKFADFAQVNRNQTIEWLIKKGLELKIGSEQSLAPMRTCTDRVLWEEFARKYGAWGRIAKSRGLLGPNTFPIIIALQFAEDRELQAPFDIQKAAIPEVEVYKERFLVF